MPVVIHPRIEAKIGGDDHGNVTATEVHQCFENHFDGYCMDSREKSKAHDSSLQTQWFVGETNRRRRLKIVFVRDGADVHLKSAYLATPEIERIYKKYKAC